MSIVKSCLSYWRAWTLLGSIALGIVTGAAGLGTGIERALQDLAWRLRGSAASSDLHIVEIDGRSISAIDRWPWPRSHHARVVDELRRAGAASIAFDVDFSSHSTPPEDAALAAALARTGGEVILPTFRQRAGGGRAGWTDALPIAPLREHSIAAAVSILPNADGYVRRAPVGVVTEGIPRPSLSAMIAGMPGNAGGDFPIDFAIDPASIPRHSFIDIQRSNFDPSEIAGKHIVIGATAVEMGDRYVVPLHGVLPGVVIQALATETLMRGLPREIAWPIGLLPAVLLACLIVRTRSRRGLMAATLTAPIAIFSVDLAGQIFAHWYVEIAPAIVAVLSASVAVAALQLMLAARRRRLQDAETGMPNRMALVEALRGEGLAGVVAARIAELDKIASGLGPSGTAELILRLGDRIMHLEQGATVYRVEDRVLCWRCDEEDDLERRLTALRAAMLHPVEVRGRRVDVTLALGYARDAAGEPDRTIANAAMAAVRARTAGAAWHVHEIGDEAEVGRELSLLGELDEAIDREQIEVFYQPKLDISSGRISSVEALVRWHHPTHGFMSPDQFIPLAERNDRIAPLTLHVLKRAIADRRVWEAAGHHLTAAVNVSAKLLNSEEFISDLRRLIQESAIEPDSLTFEVTESAAMRDPEAAAAALHSFKALGIAISMDDYGTGQSTLSYLKRFPLDELKIDRSFVQQSHRNHADAVLVRSTVELAHELGLKVVAEGVEETECLSYLRSIGCDMAQGYLISRPEPAADIMHLLNRDAARAA